MSDFYAYVHVRPNGEVFYVGKGKGSRYMAMQGRSAYHQNVINKHGTSNILVGKMDCSSEKIAFNLERGLIKCLRRMGVELTNLTDGGEGTSGYNHSEATKETCRYWASGERNAWFGKKRPEHAKLLTGRSRPDQSTLMRERHALGQVPPGMLGKNHSEATKELMRIASTERNRKLAKTQRGVPLSEDHKARISAGRKGNRWVIKDGVIRQAKEPELSVLLSRGWRLGKK